MAVMAETTTPAERRRADAGRPARPGSVDAGTGFRDGGDGGRRRAIPAAMTAGDGWPPTALLLPSSMKEGG